jgi:hypothetical protein
MIDTPIRITREPIRLWVSGGILSKIQPHKREITTKIPP